MALVTKSFSDIITFTRTGTNATYFNSAGVLTSAGADVPRFDYNPATLAAQGLLIEEQRTNSIRNNTMQGAVAGTPGTLPLNWVITGTGLGTLTQQIVGVGTTANGIAYIDIKLTGTISTAGLNYAFEPNTGGIGASSGQTWTGSNYVAIVGGNTTNITAIRCASILGRTSGGAATADTFNSGDNKASLTSTLQRFSVTGTLADGTTATLQPAVSITLPGSGTIGDPTDGITLRIGLPQLELGAFATSVIPTTTTALTRSADVASVNTLSPWYNATAGTLYAEYIAANSAQNNVATSLSDGTNDNRMIIRATNSSAQTVFIGVASTVTQWNDVIVTALLNTTTKSAFAYATNDIAWVRNGGTVGTDPTATIPTVNRLQLGLDGAGTFPLNGYLRRIVYYPRRLSNAELQAITA